MNYGISDVNILSDDSTYAVDHSSVRITGVVKWVAGQVTFPDANWNDFVLVIASWWMEGVIKLRSSNDPVIFRFMDGPFYVKCTNSGSQVIGEFVDDRNSHKVVFGWVTPLMLIDREVRNFAASVLHYCVLHDVSGTDVDALQSLLLAAKSQL